MRALPVSITVGDFNGDGHLDFATANISPTVDEPGTVSILLGRGDGTFHAAPEVGVGGCVLSPSRWATSTVMATWISRLRIVSSARCRSCWGGAMALSTPPQDVGVGGSPQSITVGDFNGDGHLDLATANIGANTVSILLGRGDGTFFLAASEFGVGVQPSSVTVGDFNGDGRQDLATANISPIRDEPGTPCRSCSTPPRGGGERPRDLRPDRIHLHIHSRPHRVPSRVCGDLPL